MKGFNFDFDDLLEFTHSLGILVLGVSCLLLVMQVEDMRQRLDKAEERISTLEQAKEVPGHEQPGQQ